MTIKQMLADNRTVIPNAKILYVGWLTKEVLLKHVSSIVVEFTESEAANAIIYAGMAWDCQIYHCQLYDRSCRIKQCFRCYKYGHIGTQCNAFQVCGHCAELHETKHCKQKAVEGFTPQCAVCKGAHTAWSNACPARKEELQRVEQAKQGRSTYWHVPPKVNTAQLETQHTQNIKPRRETRTQAAPLPGHTTGPGPEETMSIGSPSPGRNDQGPPAPTYRHASQAPALAPGPRPNKPEETSAIVPTPTTLPEEEVWVTPAILYELTGQPELPEGLQHERDHNCRLIQIDIHTKQRYKKQMSG